jgi:hypothetical protein
MLKEGFPIPRIDTKPYCSRCYQIQKHKTKLRLQTEKRRNLASRYNLCPECGKNLKLTSSHMCVDCRLSKSNSRLMIEVKNVH